MQDKIKLQEAVAASVARNAGVSEDLGLRGHYVVECRDADGNLKWRDTIANLVTTVGKNDALDKYLSGSAYTVAFYIGLISSVSYSAIAAADTMSSHAGWRPSAPARAVRHQAAPRIPPGSPGQCADSAEKVEHGGTIAGAAHH